MAKQEYPVGAFGVVGFFQKTRLDLTRDPVHTADGRQDPQLIADPHFPAGAAIDLNVAICRLPNFGLKIRLIAVLVQIAEIGAGIVRVNVFTRRNVRQRMADGQTVFHHVFPFSNGDQGKFVSTPNGLA